MSEKDIQITYNTSLTPLEDLLARINQSGDYFSAGTWETPMPTLNIEGIGTVSFPVPSDQAQKIVLSAKRAPYGRGDKTLVDENVRKVWQIVPEKILLHGKGWERSLQELVAKAATDLGCDSDKVVAEFYKMLVYDEGGFFATHRDTEKTPGMFGTLVIVLPSAHEGGDLIICHAGRKTVVNLHGDEPGEIRYAAFYADCEHEVRPVTKGYRICFVYNLSCKPKTKPPTTPDHRPMVESAAKIFKKWVASSGGPLKLIYLLEHHYTQAALSFGGLKNIDFTRAAVLREAAERARCMLHLGIVHVEESGTAEHTGDCYSYGRRRYNRWGHDDDNDDEEDSSDFEVGEVCDGRYYIDQWRNTADQPVAFGEIPIGDNEILPAEALDGEQPDEAHFSEATGNAGASFERTYLRAALVLWPEDRFDEVCASGGIDATIVRLGQLVSTANSAAKSEKPAIQERVVRFVDLIPREWTSYKDHSERLMRLLSHLARFKDKALIETVAPRYLADHYDARQNKALLACGRVLGPQRGCNFFATLFTVAASMCPGGCMKLWQLLATTEFSKHPVELDVLFEILATAATNARQWPESQRRGKCDPTEQKNIPSPELLADFLAALETTLGEAKCCKFLNALATNPDFFAPETLLLPCLECIENKKTFAALPVIVHLWEQCASFYLRRSATPPPKPTDWTQSVSIPGSDKNPLLYELERFARDPDAHEHRFPVREALRLELHRAIQHAGLDMTHLTERHGSPYTLVCTKTRASYERACRQYHSDLADIKRLLALPVTKAKATFATATRLRKTL